MVVPLLVHELPAQDFFSRVTIESPLLVESASQPLAYLSPNIRILNNISAAGYTTELPYG